MASGIDPSYLLDDDEDDDSEGWSEMDVESESILTCLFCPKPFKTMAVALEHCKSEHGFDLMALKRKFSMDCYSYISLVNFVRQENVVPSKISSCETPIWLGEKYLTPVLQEDPWLMFDFEGLESPMDSRTVSPDTSLVLRKENGIVTINEQTYSQLLETITLLRNQVSERETAMKIASDQIETMKKVTQNLVGTDDSASVDRNLARLRISEDHEYFSSYSHFGIHHTMLADKPRTTSYRDAILKNGTCIQGKKVLDVGCGTGILSMFCVQVGASKVYGVDQSDVIYYAMDIVRENSVEDKIDLIKGRVEDISLPVEKVDVIVSEWMGYFLLFEGMLDAVLLARDKYLTPGGTMLPNKCAIKLFGLSDMENYEEYVGFWSDVYGYKMTALKREVLKEAFVTIVPESSVVTAPVTVLELDLNTCSVESTDFTSEFVLQCEKDCYLTALCGFFDTLFELPMSVLLSTSPLSEKTHWKQTVFYLPQPISVKKGSTIPACITCRRKSDDNRALVIDLTIMDQKIEYCLA